MDNKEYQVRLTKQAEKLFNQIKDSREQKILLKKLEDVLKVVFSSFNYQILHQTKPPQPPKYGGRASESPPNLGDLGGIKAIIYTSQTSS